MPSIEIIHEPAPPPRVGRGRMDCTMRGIDSKTGKEVWVTDSKLKNNERIPRQEKKY